MRKNAACAAVGKSSRVGKFGLHCPLKKGIGRYSVGRARDVGSIEEQAECLFGVIDSLRNEFGNSVGTSSRVSIMCLASQWA